MKKSAYQTYSERYMVRSPMQRRVARSIVNKFFPAFRYKKSFLTTDGPLAPPDPTTVTLHGKPHFSDPYKYLENAHDPRTLQYIKLERKHHWQFDQRFDLQGGKFRLWQELDQRLLITTRESGFDKGEERIGDFIYYTRSKQDEGDVSFHRKRPGQGDPLGDDLIDSVELMRQFGYASCTIGTVRVSQDGQYIGYTLSVEGGDRYICHVKSIDHGGMFHVIRSTNIINIEFGAKNTFYYTECNDLNRPFRVMMLELRPGILPEPVEVYRDEDERFFVDVRKTKDNKFMIITSDSKERGNVLVLPASYPHIPKELEPLFPDRKPVEIAGKEAWGWLEHHGPNFIMVTSKDNSPNFKIVYAREEVVLLGGKNFNEWQDLVAHDPGCQILDVDIFESHLVVFENPFEFERMQQIRVIDIAKGVEKADKDKSNHVVLHFPPMSQITPGLNKNFVQDSFNFSFSSIIQPVKECVYDFKNKLTPSQVRGQAPSTLYTQRQHESLSPWDYMWPYHMFNDTYTAHDGEQIPITICQKRDTFVEEITEWEPMSNTARYCLLYVYGSYGEVPGMHFQPLPFMWMVRRRWVVAFAHIRGGGEKGSDWAEAGKGKNKMNGVQDFVGACKYLVNQGYTLPSRLVVMGNSAGAVPIGAAMNIHGRDLFHLALLRAPFLDIIGTMMNPELPLSLSEREDWGDPLNNADDLELLKQYDPYYNIRDDIDYPSMVLSACMDDDRVPAWNALKYAARIRENRRRRNVDPIRWAMHTRFPAVGGHYHWNQTLPTTEELCLTVNHFNMPSTYYKTHDMDAMQQMHNFFKTGLMDHDDQYQTFVKWENWEREKMEYFQKLHTFDWEPNFRVLRSKKHQYYWSANYDDGSLQQRAEDVASGAYHRKVDEEKRGYQKQQDAERKKTEGQAGGMPYAETDKPQGATGIRQNPDVASTHRPL